MSKSLFSADFGSVGIEFVTGIRHGNGKTSWFETAPVPAEWQKVHDFIVESRKFVDLDDLDGALYSIEKLSEGKYRFSVEFNKSGNWNTGTLTTRPDGSLKLEYTKRD